MTANGRLSAGRPDTPPPLLPGRAQETRTMISMMARTLCWGQQPRTRERAQSTATDDGQSPGCVGHCGWQACAAGQAGTGSAPAWPGHAVHPLDRKRRVCQRPIVVVANRGAGVERNTREGGHPAVLVAQRYHFAVTRHRTSAPRPQQGRTRATTAVPIQKGLDGNVRGRVWFSNALRDTPRARCNTRRCPR